MREREKEREQMCACVCECVCVFVCVTGFAKVACGMTRCCSLNESLASCVCLRIRTLRVNVCVCLRACAACVLLYVCMCVLRRWKSSDIATVGKHECVSVCVFLCMCADSCETSGATFLDGPCSTVRCTGGLLDWFEVNLWLPELFLLRVICALSVFVCVCGFMRGKSSDTL